MKLIMNADDFGLTPKVNQAILQCIDHGIVKSTTLMVNQQGTEDAVALINSGQVNADVGLHVTFTSGAPILPAEQVADLVDKNGMFLSRQKLANKENISIKQAYNEMHAQYQFAMDAGINISHIDTHHFAATQASLQPAYMQFVRDIGLPCRRFIERDASFNVPMPDAFDLQFYDQGASMSKLQALLLAYQETLPNGTLELMCHPGLIGDSDLTPVSSYVTKRAEETSILTSPALSLWLEQHQIQCIGFNQLQS